MKKTQCHNSDTITWVSQLHQKWTLTYQHSANTLCPIIRLYHKSNRPFKGHTQLRLWNHTIYVNANKKLTTVLFTLAKKSNTPNKRFSQNATNLFRNRWENLPKPPLQNWPQGLFHHSSQALLPLLNLCSLPLLHLGTSGRQNKPSAMQDPELTLQDSKYNQPTKFRVNEFPE